MKLYAHPVSAYSQKALIALYEKGIDFDLELVNLFDPAARADFKKMNPSGKIPLLVLDDGTRIPESTIIIQYLEDEFGAKGTRLIPADKTLARQTRLHDRLFDLYMNEPMTTVFFDGRKPEAEREPKRVAAAKAMLDGSYAAYDHHLVKHTWAVGDAFTMADCAAAPALGYLRMVYPFLDFKNLTAYANRLAERPSYERVLEQAMPFMKAFK